MFTKVKDIDLHILEFISTSQLLRLREVSKKFSTFMEKTLLNSINGILSQIDIHCDGSRKINNTSCKLSYAIPKIKANRSLYFYGRGNHHCNKCKKFRSKCGGSGCLYSVNFSKNEILECKVKLIIRVFKILFKNYKKCSTFKEFKKTSIYNYYKRDKNVNNYKTSHIKCYKDRKYKFIAESDFLDLLRRYKCFGLIEDLNFQPQNIKLDREKVLKILNKYKNNKKIKDLILLLEKNRIEFNYNVVKEMIHRTGIFQILKEFQIFRKI